MTLITAQLAHSPFFEDMARDRLEALVDKASTMTVAAGEHVFDQDSPADACYVLLRGRVRLVYQVQPRAGEPGDDSDPEITVRRYEDAGRFLGWSALVAPFRYRGSVIAEEPTELVRIGRDQLTALMERHPEFGVQIMQRLIWILGSRLREARVRMVAQRYEHEIAAIRALLHQSAPELSVDSPLHKLPIYLENRLTLADAFEVLELLTVHGTQRERDLAQMALEILADVRKELTLYQDLQSVYETVAGAPKEARPEDVRARCCTAFVKLFDQIDYVIKGEENLPEKAGFIVVMNHLVNHPDNTLPNEFQLTLDTHFVSSMILYRAYRSTPIRVIRTSRRDEFGHQRYYDRLGYIYVYSGHVDEADPPTDRSRDEQRTYFLDAARDHLLAGRNMVICPEGTSVRTEQSPVAFKAGAFRLAAYVEPEPLILPISVANFDKKITRTRVAAVIQQPFRLSDRIARPFENADLFAFLESFQEQFQGFVRQAIELCNH